MYKNRLKDILDKPVTITKISAGDIGEAIFKANTVSYVDDANFFSYFLNDFSSTNNKINGLPNRLVSKNRMMLPITIPT